MNLKTNPSVKISLQVGLILAFLAVLLVEVFMGYKFLYSNVFGKQPEVIPGNVVRVNFPQYQSTIQYLEGLYGYQPEPLSLPRDNPFR